MDESTILTVARDEAARMQALAGEADPAGEVCISVEHFRKLGELVTALAEMRIEQAAEAAVPGGPRDWVPLDHFARLKARHDALQRLASCNVPTFAIPNDRAGQAGAGLLARPQQRLPQWRDFRG